jgi:hypothetical protein
VGGELPGADLDACVRVLTQMLEAIDDVDVD